MVQSQDPSEPANAITNSKYSEVRSSHFSTEHPSAPYPALNPRRGTVFDEVKLLGGSFASTVFNWQICNSSFLDQILPDPSEPANAITNSKYSEVRSSHFSTEHPSAPYPALNPRRGTVFDEVKLLGGSFASTVFNCLFYMACLCYKRHITYNVLSWRAAQGGMACNLKQLMMYIKYVRIPMIIL
eukprot:COSAG05_NODE_380_length_10564_cov_116.331676_4_plen_185_part_00